ncbi:MAG: glycine--tRNA ligase subunit beta [Armatimonadota bacterium]|nr:glycine--tRNA ligase subunit beta [Armatimonadota bacterium]
MASRRGPATLLLEIGCEELPPGGLAGVLAQLAADAAAALREARLAAGTVATTGTLRRLVLIVADVAPRQTDHVTRVRGPAARIAYDGSGAPTQAAIGFARSQGVPVDALQVREVDGGRYVVAEVRERGRPAAAVLAGVLPQVVAGLAFPKTMQWKAGGMRFGRPIRWVVALLGDRVIPLRLAGLRAGRRTYGHRFLASGAVTLKTADSYAAAMRRAGVVLDPSDRRARITEGARALAAAHGGMPLLDEHLLEEMVWATEHPTPVLGTFDPALAHVLPREIVLVTLQHHQKSFGVQDANGRLLPAFVAVRDGGTSHLATVRTGHEWVVRARLEDARFFLEEDRRRTFEQWHEALARLAHAAGLGSMADHVERLGRMAAWVAEAAGLDAGERETVRQAARWCKVDLVTAMVGEFPELQGVVGRIYALERGLPAAVATAIEEHYWPKTQGGAPPRTRPGAVLALADRALLLAGAVRAGLEPTGSQDPYGLRRAASGIAAILTAHAFTIGLRALYHEAVALFDPEAGTAERVVDACVTLTLQRQRMTWLDQGIAYDTVDAVLATGVDDIVDLTARVRALQRVRQDPVMPRLATGFARASRILSQGQAAAAVDEGLLAEGPERDLYTAWRAQRREVEAAVRGGDYAAALHGLARLADPIDRFFDDVLVMAPDPAVRANRLAVLRDVTRTFLHVADFSKLAG